MSKYKIIFLDVDGVLNHEAFYSKRQEEGIENYPSYPLCEIDYKCVEVLNEIISKTGAKVVVSSTWRHGRTVEELQSILDQSGFKGEIIDKTPSFDHDECVRGNEIRKWIQNNFDLLGADVHHFENYVIFDDDNDMLYSQKDNFLQVDRWVGLTYFMAARAIRILNRGRSIETL
jgi:hypothetical protein